MYPTVRDPLVSMPPTRTSRWPRASRNVLMLGLTSLFTDISSEMMTAVLPLYFVLELRMTPFQFGVIDGLYQGVSAAVRVASGFVADAGQRHKLVASVGYALSTACRLGLLVAGQSWSALTAVLMLDRIGKGIRTAPRDALITLSSRREALGEAFGVHRALDTVGAMIGPVAAFAVLALLPGAYDVVFVVSLVFAVIGLSVIVLFVQNRQGAEAVAAGAGVRRRFREVAANRQLRRVLTAGGLLGTLTASDALIYLLVQRQGSVAATVFPLLYVGTAVVYLLLAVPFGRLADRVGRRRLFVWGHLAIVGVYALLLWQPVLSMAGVLLAVGLVGVYYAATDGVLAALAGGVLPAGHMSTGQALVSTVWAVARLLAATMFGACWTVWGAEGALHLFLIGMLASVAAAFLVLRNLDASPAE